MLVALLEFAIKQHTILTIDFYIGCTIVISHLRDRETHCRDLYHDSLQQCISVCADELKHVQWSIRAVRLHAGLYLLCCTKPIRFASSSNPMLLGG